LLTFLAAILAMVFVHVEPFSVVKAWYKGFWTLLSFAMQMILILVAGYAIAISPPASRLIDWLATKIKTPIMVYGTVTLVGCIFTLISWGWIVMIVVLARELAQRVKKGGLPTTGRMRLYLIFTLARWSFRFYPVSP
jgi:short-chain fatty acids transporter